MSPALLATGQSKTAEPTTVVPSADYKKLSSQAQKATSNAYKLGGSSRHKVAAIMNRNAAVAAPNEQLRKFHNDRAASHEREVPRADAELEARNAANAAAPINRTPSTAALAKARTIVSSANLTPAKHQEAVHEVAKHVDTLPSHVTDNMKVQFVPDLSKVTAEARDKNSKGVAWQGGGGVRYVFIRADVATPKGDQEEKVSQGLGHVVTGGNTGLQNVLAHEIGHHVHDASGQVGTNETILKNNTPPSKYAQTNHMEHAAEAYAKYYLTGQGHGSQIVDRTRQ